MPKYSELLRDDLIEFREYQDNIALKAVEKNTLIVIPTALGKTIIAIIALSMLIEDGGKCIFLAPTRPLVHQHAANIRKFINLPEESIVEVTGEIKKSVRKNLYHSARVIVSTPQVINNDSSLFYDIKNEVRVVIFDEAHRAIGNYSYVEVANVFADSRIIATTASPGGDRAKIDAFPS
ncbi:MAG: DEAD/DEAH box helicase family protein, partial [Candidatus Thermoplasmatota archaeon]|nr:DEAD/DEAH box helicase family protein [Candidatus Thermoplasmatota archaeon]